METTARADSSSPYAHGSPRPRRAVAIAQRAIDFPARGRERAGSLFTMSGLFSALVALALTSVVWSAKVGAVVGALLGGALAYVLIGRVIREQGATPAPVGVRRLAAASCLVWALVLPVALASAGLLWGLARGLGNVVEGPVSTTVRATTHTWLGRANALRTGVLSRYPLAKRLSESELMTVVHAAPQWTAEILDPGQAGAALQDGDGAPIPPQAVAFLREELHRLIGDHGSWIVREIDRLRARAQGAAANRPTLQETIEALVAPEVFHDAASTIRGKVGRYVRLVALAALGLAALLAGALWLAWRRLARPTAARADTPAPPAAAAHG
jgi:hypothetical protein